jgi:hypothetical protein
MTSPIKRWTPEWYALDSLHWAAAGNKASKERRYNFENEDHDDRRRAIRDRDDAVMIRAYLRGDDE